jgi:hypothetical protein
MIWLVTAAIGLLFAQQFSSMQTMAIVEGVAVDDSTGQPLSGVQVSLVPAEGQLFTPRQPRPVTTTAQNGSFLLQTTMSGEFRVIAVKDGFNLATGTRTASATGSADGPLVRLHEGIRVKDLLMPMVRSGSVSGTLVDDQGRPIVQGQVWLFRYGYDQEGHYALRPINGNNVSNGGGLNDRGDFRLFNVRPGDYYIGLWTPPGGGVIASVPTLYYPSMSSDQTKSMPVSVLAGEELRLGTLQWPARSQTFNLALRVVLPNVPMQVQVRIADSGFLIASPASPAEQVVRIVPGHYDLVLESSPSPDYYALSSFDVVGSDVVQELTLRPALSLSGKILIEDITEGRIAAPPAIRCLLDARSSNNCNSKVSPGVHIFDIRGLPLDAYIASAVANGRELLSDRVEVTSDTNFEILIGRSGGVLSGTLRTTAGQKLTNGLVVLVPEPRFRGSPFRYRSGVSDVNGQFELHAIPPGSYKIFAWSGLDGAAYRNDDFIKEYEDLGQSIVIATNEHSTLDVTALQTK